MGGEFCSDFLRIWAKLPHFGKKGESFLSRLKKTERCFFCRHGHIQYLLYHTNTSKNQVERILRVAKLDNVGGVTLAHFWSLVALRNLVLKELYLTENTNTGSIAHDRGINRIKSLLLDSGITLSSKIMAKFPHLTVRH